MEFVVTAFVLSCLFVFLAKINPAKGSNMMPVVW